MDDVTRTVITIRRSTLQHLKRVAADRHISMAALMRDVLEGRTTLAYPKPRGGVGASGGKDLGRRSGDEHLEPPPWRS